MATGIDAPPEDVSRVASLMRRAGEFYLAEQEREARPGCVKPSFFEIFTLLFVQIPE